MRVLLCYVQQQVLLHFTNVSSEIFNPKVFIITWLPWISFVWSQISFLFANVNVSQSFSLLFFPTYTSKLSILKCNGEYCFSCFFFFEFFVFFFFWDTLFFIKFSEISSKISWISLVEEANSISKIILSI